MIDKKMSVVIPAFDEEAMIEKTAFEIGRILKSAEIAYELIFVDDGSRDGTWNKIETVSGKDGHIKGISFSRNFGKEAAIIAGLEQACGECCAVIDCDLQHPPEVLVDMYRRWQDGYEVVEGVKLSRGRENPVHTFFSRIFYALISRAAEIDMSRASDFKLLDRKAVDAFLRLPERNVFFRALSSWVGFKTAQVEFHVREREAGSSKWSAFTLVKYAVTNITSFTTLPMQLVTGCGVVFFIFSIVFGAFSLIKYMRGNSLEGFTTVILLLLLIGSILMFSLGVIGYYLSKIYNEIKHRPRYIVGKMTGEPPELH